MHALVGGAGTGLHLLVESLVDFLERIRYAPRRLVYLGHRLAVVAVVLDEVVVAEVDTVGDLVRIGVDVEVALRILGELGLYFLSVGIWNFSFAQSPCTSAPASQLANSYDASACFNGEAIAWMARGWAP